MNWSPDHPNWEYGHWDARLALLESMDTVAALAQMGVRYDGRSVLCLGCGSGKWEKRMFAKAGHLVLTDLHPGEGIRSVDVGHLNVPQVLGWNGGEKYEVLHARRLLSNLPKTIHSLLIAAFRKLAKNVVIVDVFDLQAARGRNLRALAGVPMKKPAEGGKWVDYNWLAREYPDADDTPVAADYWIKTRLIYPLLLRRDLSPEEDKEALASQVLLPSALKARFCPHRLIRIA
jgi:hypothetical protein